MTIENLTKVFLKNTPKSTVSEVPVRGVLAFNDPVNVLNTFHVKQTQLWKRIEYRITLVRDNKEVFHVIGSNYAEVVKNFNNILNFKRI